MVKVGIAGCSGRMGRFLVKDALLHPQIKLVGGTVRKSSAALNQDLATLAGLEPCSILATDDVEQAFSDADVIIDFTLPDVAMANCDYYLTHQKSVVLGGTGFDASQQSTIDKAAAQLAIVQGRNMSIGINLCYELVEKAATVLRDFDVEIFEAHHRQKKDAPSGSALAFGETIAKARDQQLNDVQTLNRNGVGKARGQDEIGFSSIRAGDIFGEHTVYFADDSQRVEITHRASSRQAFSQGAIVAALWVSGKAPGLYSMKQVLGL